VVLAPNIAFRFENGRQIGAETDSRPDTVRKAVEGCLRRLQSDHIDLLDVKGSRDMGRPSDRTGWRST
jgi:aryl-alcohol dehydrogenase-like predicted oxidoreductase